MADEIPIVLPSPSPEVLPSLHLEPESVDLATYVGVLLILFMVTPISILVIRYYKLSPYLSLEMFAHKMPFEKLKQLIQQNGAGGAAKRPLSQQLEAYLYTHTSWGFILDVAQALLSLVSVALFIASSYRPPTEAEPLWAMVLELLLTLYFLGDYALRQYMSKDRLKYYFTPTSLLDYITIVPGLVGILVAESAFDSQAWLVARTLRVFRIFRVVRMMRVVTLSPGSSLQRQISILIVTVLSMVFCAAGIYQIVESTPDDFVPFHRAMLYMTIIVIGRPPVPHKTDAAVVMVTITIMVAATVIPTFVAELVRLYFETQGSETYNSDPKTPHVVVCGDINTSRLKALLGQFFHKSREPDYLSPVVVLSEQKYEGPLRSLIEQQRYSGSVTYVRGSARRPADLRRAGVQHSSTVIVLCSRSGVNVDTAIEADNEVTAICLAIKAVNKRVRVLAQLRRPRSRDHLMCLPGWRDHDRAVAIASLSMTLVGVGAQVPGLPTLLTNLIHQGNKLNARSSNPRRRKFVARGAGNLKRNLLGTDAAPAHSFAGWIARLLDLSQDVTMALSQQAGGGTTPEEALTAFLRPSMSPVEEYTSGFAQEMFAFPVTPGLAGRSFGAAARLAYLRYGVLLIGVRVPLAGPGSAKAGAGAGSGPASSGGEGTPKPSAPVSGSGAPGGPSDSGSSGGGDVEQAYQVLLFPPDLTLAGGMFLHAIGFDTVDVAHLLQATGAEAALGGRGAGGGLGMTLGGGASGGARFSNAAMAGVSSTATIGRQQAAGLIEAYRGSASAVDLAAMGQGPNAPQGTPGGATPAGAVGGNAGAFAAAIASGNAEWAAANAGAPGGRHNVGASSDLSIAWCFCEQAEEYNETLAALRAAVLDSDPEAVIRVRPRPTRCGCGRHERLAMDMVAARRRARPVMAPASAITPATTISSGRPVSGFYAPQPGAGAGAGAMPADGAARHSTAPGSGGSSHRSPSHQHAHHGSDHPHAPGYGGVRRDRQLSEGSATLSASDLDGGETIRRMGTGALGDEGDDDDAEEEAAELEDGELDELGEEDEEEMNEEGGDEDGDAHTIGETEDGDAAGDLPGRFGSRASSFATGDGPRKLRAMSEVGSVFSIGDDGLGPDFEEGGKGPLGVARDAGKRYRTGSSGKGGAASTAIVRHGSGRSSKGSRSPRSASAAAGQAGSLPGHSSAAAATMAAAALVRGSVRSSGGVLASGGVRLVAAPGIRLSAHGAPLAPLYRAPAGVTAPLSTGGSSLSPHRDHILICGVNDKIGLLLRALQMPPPSPPRPFWHFGPAPALAAQAARAAEAPVPGASRRSSGTAAGGGGSSALVPSGGPAAGYSASPPAIVILCSVGDRPRDEAVNAMHAGSSRWMSKSRVQWVNGSPSDMGDLLRAGVETARASIIISCRRPAANADGNDNLADDVDAIVVASAIYKLNPSLHLITEITHGPHASYLRPCGTNLTEAEESTTAFVASIKAAAALRARQEARQRREEALRASAAAAKAAGAGVLASNGTVGRARARNPSARPPVPAALTAGRPPRASSSGPQPAPASSSAPPVVPTTSVSAFMSGSPAVMPAPAPPAPPALEGTALASSSAPATAADPAQPAPAPSTLAPLGASHGGHLPVLSALLEGDEDDELDSPMDMPAAPGGDGGPGGAAGAHADSTGAAAATAWRNRVTRDRIRQALAAGDSVGRTASEQRPSARPALAGVFGPRDVDMAAAPSLAAEVVSASEAAAAPAPAAAPTAADDAAASAAAAAFNPFDGDGDESTGLNSSSSLGLAAVGVDVTAVSSASGASSVSGSGAGDVSFASTATAGGVDVTVGGDSDPWSATGAVSAADIETGVTTAPPPPAPGLRARAESLMHSVRSFRTPTIGGLGGRGRTRSGTGADSSGVDDFALDGVTGVGTGSASGGDTVTIELPRGASNGGGALSAGAETPVSPSPQALAPAPTSGAPAGGNSGASGGDGGSQGIATDANAPTAAAPSEMFGAPAFAAGRAFTTVTIDALMCEAHFSPHLIFLIKQLVRASRKRRLQLLPVADAVAMAMLVSPETADVPSGATAPPTGYRTINTYGELFEGLLRGWHLLPMGLYRRLQPGVLPRVPVVSDPVAQFTTAFGGPGAAGFGGSAAAFRNDKSLLSYVFTNPPPDTPLNVHDHVYVLRAGSSAGDDDGDM